MKVQRHLRRDNLEKALEYIKKAESKGRVYRYGEIGDILTKLEVLGCIKSSDAGTTGVDIAMGGSESIKDILFGSNLTKYIYVKDLPRRIWK